MKNWQAALVLALSAAIAAAGWLFSSPKDPQQDSQKKSGAAVLARADGKRTEVPVRVRQNADKRRPADFAFGDIEGEDKSDKDFNLAFGDDFGFEDEIKEKLSTVLQQIYDEYLAAEKKENRKAMLAALGKLLAKAQAGQPLPRWLKDRMIEDIKWIGSAAMPELMAMAADADAEVSSQAIDALQDLLWDFNTTPQQVSDALLQVVRLTTDKSVIEPFIFEMDSMGTSLRVATALGVLDSGNAVATQCLMENVDFVFDDFDGKIKTREDIAAYGVGDEE